MHTPETSAAPAASDAATSGGSRCEPNPHKEKGSTMIQTHVADVGRYDEAVTIPPIKCATWCVHGDGHTKELMRDDQTCWGQSHYLDLTLEDVKATELGPTETDRFRYCVDVPRIGPCGYRGFNKLPCVYVHIYLPAEGECGLDMSVKLTAAEARELAAALVQVADEIGREA